MALGRQHLGIWLARLGQHFPDIALEVYLSDRFVNLRQEGYDFALRHADQVSDAYVSKRLCATRAHLVASPLIWPAMAVLRTHRNWPAIAACCTAATSAARSGRSPQAGRGRARQTGGLPQRQQQRAAARGVAHGLGIAMVPDFSLGDCADLEPVLPQWDCYAGFGRSLYLLKPFSATPTEAHRVVEQALAEHFRPGFATPA